nr:type IV secretion system DNA-binding domain-containing protein [uncultured Sulfurimonas sp.]
MELIFAILSNPKIYEVALYMLLLVIALYVLYFAYTFFFLNGKIRRGLIYSWGGGSSANPPKKMWIDGHRWTNLSTIILYSLKNKKVDLPVKVNQFRYWDDYVERSKMPKFLRDYHESNDVYLDATMMARGVLVVGSAGSGKTEWVNSVVNQIFYKKAVIYSKKGDFEKYFFRPAIDILVNPKLKDGVIHNILGEDIQYIMEYINTLMSASIGKSQDYFSGSAKQKLENFCQRIKIKERDDSLTIRGKWNALIEFYEQAMIDSLDSDQKSEKDIMSTVRATMNLLYLSAYRIENGTRTFTVKDFYESPEMIRLFLNSTDKSLDGMLAATAAVLIKYQLAMPDIKDWDPHFLVAWFLDEYLSFAAVIDDEILAEISRVGRSKGIVPFKFVQSLPSKEEERKELTSNVQYILVFAIVENEKTIPTIINFIGKMKYEHLKVSESRTNGSKTYNSSLEPIEENIVSQYQMNILQNESFSHILFAPKENKLYKGYTPPPNLKLREYFDITKEIDLTEFYRWKINREDELKKYSGAVKAIVTKDKTSSVKEELTYQN